MRRFEARQLNSKSCRLPPFGKKLILSKSDSVFIFMGAGQSWQRAANEYQLGVTRSLVLPDGDHPASFSWPVYQRDVIVIDFGNLNELNYKRLSLALLKQGSVSVIVIHEPSNTSFRYAKSGGVHV